MQTIETKKFKEILKLDADRSKFKRYCKCGHSIVFPQNSKVDKKVCNHCGSFVFKNDLIEFEYRLKEKQKKM